MARTNAELSAAEIISVEELSGIANNSVIYKDNSGIYQAVALGASGKVLQSNGATSAPTFETAGSGDVVGPASSTDSVPALFDGTTGKLLKNSTPTGTGNPVLQTSPTLTTPTLGAATATSVNKVAITAPATSATLTIADGATLTATATATVSGTNTGDQTSIVGITGTIAQFNTALTDGDFATLAGSETLTNKTLTSPTLTTPALGTPSSGNLSSCTADGTDAVGFRNIPQNSQSAAYTTVLADAGKHIYHPSTDANARTFTIDSNANVAYPIGTSITFVNETSQVVTIAITADTLVLAGTGTTGSRSLAQYGVATAIKVGTTRWIINGTGLT